MDERRKNTRERRTKQERQYIIRVSAALPRQELLMRLSKEPIFSQAHIYDFGVNSSHPIREELSKLLTNYRDQNIDAVQLTENKDTYGG